MSAGRMTLAPGVAADVVGGALFAARPQVWVNSPAVVVRADGGGRGAGAGGAAGDAGDAGDVVGESTASSVGETVGSEDWLWSADEGWAFSVEDGTLVSLLLALPEVNVAEDAAAGWQDVPTIGGSLRLAEARAFSRPPTEVRSCAPSGRLLVGLYEDPGTEAGPEAGPRWRLAIAEGTHLLVAGETLAGWSVTDPARYLTGDSVAASDAGTPASDDLAALFAEYCDLVTVDGVDRLLDGDPELSDRLTRCADRAAALGAAGESRALEIEVKVRQVLEDFAVL